VPITDETIDLLGKNCDDLQENISVTNGTISGKLLHVDDYTDFDEEAYAGYFLALNVDGGTGATVAVELINGVIEPKAVEGEDGVYVIKIDNTNTQRIKITSTNGGTVESKTYSLTTLVLDPQ
jgi:hypothetical protein